VPDTVSTLTNLVRSSLALTWLGDGDSLRVGISVLSGDPTARSDIPTYPDSPRAILLRCFIGKPLGYFPQVPGPPIHPSRSTKLSGSHPLDRRQQPLEFTVTLELSLFTNRAAENYQYCPRLLLNLFRCAARPLAGVGGDELGKCVTRVILRAPSAPLGLHRWLPRSSPA